MNNITGQGESRAIELPPGPIDPTLVLQRNFPQLRSVL